MNDKSEREQVANAELARLKEAVASEVAAENQQVHEALKVLRPAKERTKFYNYRVVWSEQDQEHVGLCDEFPSLSCLEPDPTMAFTGILKLVESVVAHMGEEIIPEPITERDNPLRKRMQTDIDRWLEGLRKRPGMYGGTLFGIEMVWVTVMWFEAMLLDPPPSLEALSEARTKSMDKVLNAHKWHSNVGPSFHVEKLGLEYIPKTLKLVEILDEIRTAFFANLGHPL